MIDAFMILATVAGVVLLGSASPGPNFVAVSSSALSSPRRGLLTAAGVAAASFTWAILGVTGLALLLSRSSALGAVLQWFEVPDRNRKDERRRPPAWLADTLARISDYKITRVNELLPWSDGR